MNLPPLLRQRLSQLVWVIVPLLPISTQAVTTTTSTTLTAYKVQKGDTLQGVANKFNLTPAQLASYNNKKVTDKLVIGEVLLLSGDDVAKVVSKIKPDALQYLTPTTFTYTVKSGETLNGIANRNNTTTSEILRLNKLTIDSKLAVGQKLQLPLSPKSETKPSEKATVKETDKAQPAPVVKTTTIIVTETKADPKVAEKPAATKPSTKPRATVKITDYTVASGDSLEKLAARYNISVSDLAKMNKLKPTDGLKIGQQLLVPITVANTSSDKK